MGQEWRNLWLHFGYSQQIQSELLWLTWDVGQKSTSWSRWCSQRKPSSLENEKLVIRKLHENKILFTLLKNSMKSNCNYWFSEYVWKPRSDFISSKTVFRNSKLCLKTKIRFHLSKTVDLEFKSVFENQYYNLSVQSCFISNSFGILMKISWKQCVC